MLRSTESGFGAIAREDGQRAARTLDQMQRNILTNTAVLVSMLLFALATLGCSAPRKVWTVSQHAQPNPLSGETEFAMAPLDFDDLLVGEEPEHEYVARKGDDFKEAWLSDKRAMKVLFADQLAAHAAEGGIEMSSTPDDAAFVVQASVTFIGRGYWAGMFRQRAVMMAVVNIMRPNGDLVDQIVVKETTGVHEGYAAFTAGARLRRLAEKLGAHTAIYLRGRAGGRTSS
jgi:hypothetical protein